MKIYLLFFLLLTSGILSGQEKISFNDLPPTLTYRMPEFDVENKYQVSIDSANQIMIIQDRGRKPDTKQLHFHQLIFEIPLSDLSLGSFRVAKKMDDSTRLRISIGTKKNRPTITSYMVNEDMVATVSAMDVMVLGDWNYSKQLESELKQAVRNFTGTIADQSYETNFYTRGKFYSTKYTAENVIFTGPKNPDKSLALGYYFGPSLERPPRYEKTKTNANSDFKLLSDIKKELKRLGISRIEKMPVFININETGQIESLFFPNLSIELNRQFDKRNLASFSPGLNANVAVKCKLLLIVG